MEKEFRIEKTAPFSLIGQKTILTNGRSQNLKISTQFWQTFNINLKKNYLSQSGNWIKYAFTIRENGQLFYFCGIPKRTVVPDSFLELSIPEKQYLVVEHIGPMNQIYNTYEKIYKEILPNSGYALDQTEFLHFEKYDYRFQWNHKDSILEIWLPIQLEN